MSSIEKWNPLYSLYNSLAPQTISVDSKFQTFARFPLQVELFIRFRSIIKEFLASAPNIQNSSGSGSTAPDCYVRKILQQTTVSLVVDIPRPLGESITAALNIKQSCQHRWPVSAPLLLLSPGYRLVQSTVWSLGWKSGSTSDRSRPWQVTWILDENVLFLRFLSWGGQRQAKASIDAVFEPRCVKRVWGCCILPIAFGFSRSAFCNSGNFKKRKLGNAVAECRHGLLILCSSQVDTGAWPWKRRSNVVVAAGHCAEQWHHHWSRRFPLKSAVLYSLRPKRFMWACTFELRCVAQLCLLRASL